VAAPYNSDDFVANIPGGVTSVHNRSIGVSPPVHADSAAKISAVLSGFSNFFTGITSMSYNPTVFDSSSIAGRSMVTATVDRTTGTSYPDGSTWSMPTNAKGISETGTQYSTNDDAHCVIFDRPNNRILCLRQFYGVSGGVAQCYSGGASPYEGDAQLWYNSTFSGSAPGGGNGLPGTGSGINIYAGTYYPEDALLHADDPSDQGVRHALRAIPAVARVISGTIYPAWKTDGASAGPGVQEGQVLWLDCTDSDIANISVAGSTTSKAARAMQGIARMMRRFGVYIEDRTGGSFHGSAAHRQSWELLGDPNPWPNAIGYQSPAAMWAASSGFPISKLKVLTSAFVPEEPSTETPNDTLPPIPNPPTSVVLSTVNNDVSVNVGLPTPDVNRHEILVVRRTSPAATDTPSDSPTGIQVARTGTVGDRDTVASVMQSVLAEEIKTVEFPAPLGAPWSAHGVLVDCSGLGTATSGTALVRAIAFQNSAGAWGDLIAYGEVAVEVNRGRQRRWTYIPFRASDTGFVTLPNNAHVGIHVGGTTNVLAYGRRDTLPRERFGTAPYPFVLATGPSSTLSGSLAGSIAVVRNDEGGPNDGAVLFGDAAVPDGTYYYDVYTRGISGYERLSGTPYPVTVPALATGDVDVFGTSVVTVAPEVITTTTGVPDSEVVMFPDPVEVTIEVPTPWRVVPGGAKDRRVRWENPPGEWRYVEDE
jgi:hypothetical protein